MMLICVIALNIFFLIIIVIMILCQLISRRLEDSKKINKWKATQIIAVFPNEVIEGVFTAILLYSMFLFSFFFFLYGFY